MSKIPTKRIASGVYELADGSRVQTAYRADRNGDPQAHGWNLIDPDGEWVQAFWTKAEAVYAWATNNDDGEGK